MRREIVLAGLEREIIGCELEEVKMVGRGLEVNGIEGLAGLPEMAVETEVGMGRLVGEVTKLVGSLS